MLSDPTATVTAFKKLISKRRSTPSSVRRHAGAMGVITSAAESGTPMLASGRQRRDHPADDRAKKGVQDTW